MGVMHSIITTILVTKRDGKRGSIVS